MKLRAFTLAELLIAISIIGVLLLLTMPRIVDNMIKKSYVASLQRVYISTSSAVKLMLQDERQMEVKKTYLYKATGETVDSSAGDFIKKNFKLAQNCGKSKTPCFADTYKTFNKTGNVTFPSNSDMYCATLAMRASICLVPPQASSDGTLYVDVNGTAKPNVAGRDLFVFNIYNDGFVGEKNDNSAQCETAASPVGCFKKLVKSNWVMDY